MSEHFKHFNTSLKIFRLLLENVSVFEKLYIIRNCVCIINTNCSVQQTNRTRTIHKENAIMFYQHTDNNIYRVFV